MEIKVRVPDLSGVLGPLARALGPEPSQKVFRKALSEGAKIIVKRARELAPGPGKAPKRRKGQAKGPKVYGKSGALKKSIKAYFRRGKKSQAAYIVVGANRDYKIPVRRGKKDMYAYPKNYVHLVDRGFTAIARIPGVVGRKTNYAILRMLRRYRVAGTNARDISFARALKDGFDQKLLASDSIKDSNKRRVANYIRGYRKATRTKVPGQFFMERASRETRAQAIKVASRYLLAEYAKLFIGLRAA